MGMTYAELTTRIKDGLKTVDDFWKTVPAGEERNVPKEKVEEIKSLNHNIADWQQEASELKEVTDLRGANDGTKSWLNQSSGNVRHSGEPSAEGWGKVNTRAQAGPVNLGRALLDDEAFKSWLGMVAPGGREPSKDTKVQSPPIPMPDLSIKTLVTSNTTGAGVYTATNAGAFVQPQYLPMVSLPFRPLKLRDVVTVIEATSPIINYPKITGYTNNAVETAEATSTSNGLKPESALAVALGTAVAATIPHFMPITRQALSDAPQMRDLINQFLINGLGQRLEDEMIGGDGTGANITGIHNTSGLSTQAFVTDNLTTLRKAITKAQVSPIFVEPSAYLMSPVDAEGLDLSTDNESRFYFGGPSSTSNTRLWNKPVIVSQAVPSGRVYTGDFSTVVLADLMQAQVMLFDQHSDWALRNILALLAELRVLFFLLRPAAVIEVSLGSW